MHSLVLLAQHAWAAVQANPVKSILLALSVLNALCVVGLKKLPPDSRAAHACKLVLTLIVDGVGAANAVLGMLGRPPISLQPPAPPAPTSPPAGAP